EHEREHKHDTSMRAAERADHDRASRSRGRDAARRCAFVSVGGCIDPAAQRAASSGQKAAAPGRKMNLNPPVAPPAAGTTRLTPHTTHASAHPRPAAPYAPATTTSSSAAHSVTSCWMSAPRRGFPGRLKPRPGSVISVDMELQDKVVLITGGRRIGQVVAHELATRGAHLSLAYRGSRAEAEASAEQARALAPTAPPHP